MKARLGVLLVSACYVIAGVLLYRLRRLSGRFALDSDLLVLYLPAPDRAVLQQPCCQARATRWLGPSQARAVRWGVAVAVTFVAMWVFMVIEFNTYGT